MRHAGFLKTALVVALTLALALTPALSLAEVNIVSEQSFDRSPDLNDATNTYIGRVDRNYALFDVEGKQLSDVYGYMSGKSSGLFQVVANEDNVNGMGLLDRDGQLIIPMAYGQIEVESEKWILAIVLEETSEEPYDYRALLGSGMYRIVTADVYFEGQKIGTLERADLADCSINAHGSFLSVRKVDRSGYYLNSSFERTEVSADEFSYSEFENVYKQGIFHRASGQQAFVEGCTLTPEDVEQSVWYDDNGNFIDLQGNVISQGKTEGQEYNYVYYDGGDYFRTKSNDGVGLATLDGVEVLPPVYDAVGGSGNGTYFLSGYEAVMKDGKLSYVDLAGNVTASVEYQMSESDYRGFYSNAPFVTVDNLGQKVVITATAGELAQRYQDAGYPQAGQRVLPVKLNDVWGVIDLNGNEVIPFVFRNQPEISDDGTVVVGSLTEGGYKMYVLEIFEDAPIVAPVADDGWVCPNCSETITTNFCPNDGTAKPAEDAA